MSGKLIVAGIVILILIVAAYLFHDSDVIENVKKTGRSAARKMNEEKQKREIAITDAPEIRIKEPGEKRYRKAVMDKKEYRIGRSSKDDIILNDRKVQEGHARIEKKLTGDRVCYVLINLSRVNPVEVYNADKKRYEYLSYKEGIELDETTALYIGDTKLLITLYKNRHTPGNTERVFRQTSSSEVQSENFDTSGSSDTKTFKKQFRDRSESVRIVTRNELDI